MTMLAHEALCLALLASVFCRFVRTNHTTRLAIRGAFFALGIVAAVGVVAPMRWGLVPNWFSVLTLAAILLVQFVTAFYWRQGAPYPFTDHSCSIPPNCKKPPAATLERPPHGSTRSS